MIYCKEEMIRMKENAFGDRIPDIGEIHKIKPVREYNEKTMAWILEELGVSSLDGIVQKIMEIADEYGKFGDISELSRYEEESHEILVDSGITKDRISEKLSSRANIVYNEIRDHIVGPKILDFGCGDGKIGELAAKDGHEVILTDTYRHDHIDEIVNEAGVEFYSIQGQKGKIQLQNDLFDTTLLLTVKHHSSYPLHTLNEAKRMTKPGGRVIVIESVYGIEEDSDFGRLGSENQRLSNIFFDHFYNRAIHYSDDPARKVNVPFNFRSPEEWKQIYGAFGLEQIHFKRLGIDQPTVPEYHTLHILKVLS
jgi:2-polyprenyl-3-methyl-5-hydroxy-6-metoxy-1,4-benzoquinol methylase